MQQATQQDLNNFNQKMVGNTGNTQSSAPGVFTGASAVNFLNTPTTQITPTPSNPVVVSNRSAITKANQLNQQMEQEKATYGNQVPQDQQPYQMDAAGNKNYYNQVTGQYDLNQNSLPSGYDSGMTNSTGGIQMPNFSTPEQQQAYNAIVGFQQNSDNLSKQVLQNIADRYKLLNEQQQLTNSKSENAARLAMGTYGGSGSATDQNGYINAIVNENNLKLRQLAQDEKDAYFQAQQAQQTRDLPLLQASLNQLNATRDAKIDFLKDYNKQMNDLVVKQQESKIQAQKDDIVGDLYAQGITDIPSLIKQLKEQGVNMSAKEIQDTIKNITPGGLDDLVKTMRINNAPEDLIQQTINTGITKGVGQAYTQAGKYGAGGTGIIGEYNYAIANGWKGTGDQSDWFNQYQTADANRKALQASQESGLYQGLGSGTATAVRSQVSAFKSEPVVTNFSTIQEGYNFTKSLSDKTTNPADDQALIYALAKALDPGSVVREGEYATAQKYAQSYITAYGKSVEQALAGTGFLSEDARKNIKKVIESKYKAADKSYTALRDNYAEGINEITGRMDGDKFIRDYRTEQTTADVLIKDAKQADAAFETLKSQSTPEYLQEISNRMKDLEDVLGHKPSKAEYFETYSFDLPQGNQSFNTVVGDTNPAKGIVLGVDITKYATDPKHEIKIASIVEKIPDTNNVLDFDKYIKSIAPNSKITGDMITTASTTYGVDPRLVTAIIQNDSKFGTLGHGAKNNNPGNIGQFDNLKTTAKGYKSLQEGVNAVAQWLANHKTNKYA